jgi:hypothetical protein
MELERRPLEGAVPLRAENRYPAREFLDAPQKLVVVRRPMLASVGGEAV